MTVESGNRATPARARLADLTLAEAMTLTVSDNPAAFKGKGADVLSAYDTEHLQGLREWFEGKLLDGHRDDFALRVEAITLLLDDREKSQGKLSLEDDAEIEAMDARGEA